MNDEVKFQVTFRISNYFPPLIKDTIDIRHLESYSTFISINLSHPVRNNHSEKTGKKLIDLIHFLPPPLLSMVILYCIFLN